MGFIQQFRFDPDYNFRWVGSSGTSAANPQLAFFENYWGMNLKSVFAYSNGTLSVHAVNIPLSINFNSVVMALSQSATSTRNFTIQFGLFSLNGSTLSLANSASANPTFVNAVSWVSMVTSATQNITPGPWYFGINILSGGVSSATLFGNTSYNPSNAFPGNVMYGRMTVSTNAMPANINTSDLDVTGSDVIRFPYIIITA